ncbi:hypothetical protein HYFRA_00001375 [Hymenoscyphus fraxineus]|uniref:Cell wall protein PhiA n=1 Tax=Hymenoscyphus fraxineus TaxID=746836 RepID=A0A9N9L8J3_9HELO|nr:hypothetical protein HYFRA_00001375 [Hymenoscyphus fraxineus]
MQFTNAALLSVVSALAAAAPSPQASPAPQAVRAFAVLSQQSGSSVHLANWGATQGAILAGINATVQNAPCDDGNLADKATFNLRKDDGALFLWQDKLEQRVWVDRGMGQGIVRYSANGGTQPSRQAELTGFEISNDQLLFKGQPFVACPNAPGRGHTLFVNGTSARPSGRTDCFGFKAGVVFNDSPVSCNYTNSS